MVRDFLNCGVYWIFLDRSLVMVKCRDKIFGEFIEMDIRDIGLLFFKVELFCKNFIRIV